MASTVVFFRYNFFMPPHYLFILKDSKLKLLFMKQLNTIFFNYNIQQSWIFLLLVLLGFTMTAQIEISGTVVGDDDLPIPGVTILVEGTNIGASTDFDGMYVLEVPDENSVLIFSYIGYDEQKIIVQNKTTINVFLKTSNEALDEVVVIGYGNRRKKDLTGAVSIVGNEELNAFPAVSAEQTLQGRAAGVAVQSANGGEPGAPIKIRIRGATSINASSDAIFVVDGFVGGALPPPEDIESIQVLKDASSTAIYGSRGANGVVIVTTKKGKKGKIRVDYNTSFSSQVVSNTLDLLDADQFADYIGELSSTYTQGTGNTDWQDEIFRTGQIINHQLALSGGTDRTKFYLSATYFDQEGVVIASKLDRFSFTSNINVDVSDHVKVGMNTFGRRTSIGGIRTQENSGGSGNSGVISSAFRFSPDSEILDSNGDFSLPSVGDDIDNPFVAATEIQNERVNDLFQTNLYADLTLFDGFSFKTTFGFNTRNDREGLFFPTTTLRGVARGGEAELGFRKRTSILSENYATYKKDFSFASLTATLGYSYQKDTNERVIAAGSEFISNAVSFWNLDGAANLLPAESRFTESELASYFGRINFDIADKYLLTVSARRDGSSTFSKNNKWSFFPSGAVAWNMGSEGFLEDSNVISQWKWRASYGITGNRALEANGTLANYDPVYTILGGELVNAVVIESLENPNLKWETTTQVNFGIDIGLFNNRISLTADYYDMITEDLLFERELPEISPVAGIVENVGKVENKGFEIQLTTKNFTGDFKWSTNFNFSQNKNKILELPGGQDLFLTTAPGHLLLNDTQVLREGEAVGAFYGFVYDGVYQNGDTFIPGTGFEQEAGGERYRDIAGPDGSGPDGQLSTEDRMIIGDPNPDFIAGLSNTFSYKGFDLNVFFQGSFGGDMLNFTLMELNTLNGSSNATIAALDRWSPSNPNTNVPSAAPRARRVSTRWVYDGSYVRLKNATLGYTFANEALEKLKLSKLRVYISGQNLVTFTDYPGLDPEVLYRTDNNRGNNVNIGLDYGSYPNAKAYTMGINISF